MKKNARTTIKYFIITIFVTLAVTLPTANAQDPPIFPDGGRIEGTWNMQVQWRNCDDGTAILGPAPDLRSTRFTGEQ